MGTADAKTVEALFKRLIATFEQFTDEQAEAGKELPFVDGLMGCHNFYKAIILDLEGRCQDEQNAIRWMALDTLALALGLPIERVKR